MSCVFHATSLHFSGGGKQPTADKQTTGWPSRLLPSSLTCRPRVGGSLVPATARQGLSEWLSAVACFTHRYGRAGGRETPLGRLRWCQCWCVGRWKLSLGALDALCQLPDHLVQLFNSFVHAAPREQFPQRPLGFSSTCGAEL